MKPNRNGAIDRNGRGPRGGQDGISSGGRAGRSVPGVGDPVGGGKVGTPVGDGCRAGVGEYEIGDVAAAPCRGNGEGGGDGCFEVRESEEGGREEGDEGFHGWGCLRVDSCFVGWATAALSMFKKPLLSRRVKKFPLTRISEASIVQFQSYQE